jgi:hypothetical protein
VILYLYAIAEAVDSADGLRGVTGERVECFDVHNLRLVAGQVAAVPGVSRDTLEAQDQLVRALHARASALLPFRFGTAVRDVDAAIASIDVIYPSLAERLARVRGRDQMTVRVLRTGVSGRIDNGPAAAPSDPADPTEGPGARYLRARAAARELPPELRTTFDAVRSTVRATTFEPGRHADVVGTVYQLIDRGEDATYRAGLAAAAAAQPALLLRITGPSPAYAFAV